MFGSRKMLRKEKKNVKENDFVWFQHKKKGKKNQI